MLYKHNLKNLTEAYLQTKPNSFSKVLALGNIRGTNPKNIEDYYNCLSKKLD